MMEIIVGVGRFLVLVKVVLLRNKNLVLALVGFDRVLGQTFMMAWTLARLTIREAKYMQFTVVQLRLDQHGVVAVLTGIL